MVIKAKLSEKEKSVLIENLLQNNISVADLQKLRHTVNAADLSVIITHIYDLNEAEVEKIALLNGVLKKVDNLKNSKRNAKFTKKFRENSGTAKI